MVHRRDPRAPCVCQRAAERPPGTWHREWATNPPEAAPEGSPTVAPSRSGSPFEVRVRLRGPGPEPSPGRLRAAGCPKDKEVGAVKILEGMASRFTGQRVCCSCVLIRSENLLRTDGPTTHARGPRPGPDPHPWADLLPLHLHDCKHRLTHPATGHTRARRPRLPLKLPYSRPAPPQSSPISRPTHRRRPRRRSPWLALHRSAEATAGA